MSDGLVERLRGVYKIQGEGPNARLTIVDGAARDDMREAADEIERLHRALRVETKKYAGMSEFAEEQEAEAEKLRAIVDRIPPDRLNPWHTVTVKPDGWHMAHPIDCVLAECRFDGLAQAEWVGPPTAHGVWQWHDFDDEPWEWIEETGHE